MTWTKRTIISIFREKVGYYFDLKRRLHNARSGRYEERIADLEHQIRRIRVRILRLEADRDLVLGSDGKGSAAERELKILRAQIKILRILGIEFDSQQSHEYIHWRKYKTSKQIEEKAKRNRRTASSLQLNLSWLQKCMRAIEREDNEELYRLAEQVAYRGKRK